MLLLSMEDSHAGDLGGSERSHLPESPKSDANLIVVAAIYINAVLISAYLKVSQDVSRRGQLSSHVTMYMVSQSVSFEQKFV